MQKRSAHTYTFSLKVRNTPGVLVRCAQIYGRRGHNIESMHVILDPSDSKFSNMIITASGHPSTLGQIEAQLSKLIDVVEVN